MPDNQLLRLTGGVDTSSYPKWGDVTKPAPPPDQMKSASDALGVVGKLQELSQQQHQIGMQRLQASSQIFGALAALPNPTMADVQRASVALAQVGVPQDVIRGGLGEVSSFGGDPAKIKAWAYGHVTRNMTVEQNMQAAYGMPGLTDLGGVKVDTMTRTGPQGGVRRGGGTPMPNTITPQDRMSTVEVTLPDGSKRLIPRGQIFDETGRVPGAAVPGQGQIAAPLPPIGRRSAPGATPTAPQTVPGVGINGLPSGNAPAETADQAASTQAFLDARNDLQPSRDRVTTMRLALDTVRGTNVGLGTASRQKMLNYINSLPNGWGKVLVPDGADLSNYEVARKYLAATQASAAGANRSDAALAISAAANPNTDMTKGALTETAITNIGRERMKQAQIIDHLNSGRSPAEFSNRLAREWDRVGDPNAYALPAMTPQERAEHFAKLKGPEKARFLASIRKGIETGVLTRDDLVGAVPAAGAK